MLNQRQGWINGPGWTGMTLIASLSKCHFILTRKFPKEPRLDDTEQSRRYSLLNQ